MSFEFTDLDLTTMGKTCRDSRGYPCLGDKETDGLWAISSRGGRVSFYYVHDFNGITTAFLIGSSPEYSVSFARMAARNLGKKAALGVDPFGEIQNRTADRRKAYLGELDYVRHDLIWGS